MAREAAKFLMESRLAYVIAQSHRKFVLGAVT